MKGENSFRRAFGAPSNMPLACCSAKREDSFRQPFGLPPPSKREAHKPPSGRGVAAQPPGGELANIDGMNSLRRACGILKEGGSSVYKHIFLWEVQV